MTPSYRLRIYASQRRGETMQGVKMRQITIGVTPRQITLLRKAAAHRGLSTPGEFLAALFEGIHLGHRDREPRAVRQLLPKRAARPEL